MSEERDELGRFINLHIGDGYATWTQRLDKPESGGELLAESILAAGWSRLVLDDAAVERAARALAGTLSVFKWEHIGPLTQEMYRDKARAVLAAAVEPPDA